MHFAEPGGRGLPFGYVDPLGGITTRWKGRWKYTPTMKRRSKIHQKILRSVVQQPQNTNFTTARGLKRTMEWDLHESFRNIENGVFSVCEKMYPSAQSIPDDSGPLIFALYFGFMLFIAGLLPNHEIWKWWRCKDQLHAQTESAKDEKSQSVQGTHKYSTGIQYHFGPNYCLQVRKAEGILFHSNQCFF